MKLKPIHPHVGSALAAAIIAGTVLTGCCDSAPSDPYGFRDRNKSKEVIAYAADGSVRSMYLTEGDVTYGSSYVRFIDSLTGQEIMLFNTPVTVNPAFPSK